MSSAKYFTACNLPVITINVGEKNKTEVHLGLVFFYILRQICQVSEKICYVLYLTADFLK